jgi:FkbM family methyltransferase
MLCNLCSNNFIIDIHGITDNVSRILLKHQITEPRLINFIKFSSSETTFIDIGSYLGIYSFYAHLYGMNHIYAIECSAKNIEKIKNTIEINNIKNIIVSEKCISDSRKIIEFIEVKSNLAGSHIKETYGGVNKGKSSMGLLETDILDNTINILDIETANIIIKINTVGHELEGIRGMKTFLNDIRTKNIIVKINPLISSTDYIQNIFLELEKYNFITYSILFNSLEEKWSGFEIEEKIDINLVSYEIIMNYIINNAILDILFIKSNL